MTKICAKCLEEKPITKFDVVGGHIRKICRRCRCLRVKELKLLDPNHKEKARKCKALIRARHKQRMVDHLGGKCVECGLIDEVCVFDLHHVNPQTKDRTLSSLSLYGWSVIEKELSKVVLLCSNCHRKLHVRERATLKKKGVI